MGIVYDLIWVLVKRKSRVSLNVCALTLLLTVSKIYEYCAPGDLHPCYMPHNFNCQNICQGNLCNYMHYIIRIPAIGAVYSVGMQLDIPQCRTYVYTGFTYKRTDLPTRDICSRRQYFEPSVLCATSLSRCFVAKAAFEYISTAWGPLDVMATPMLESCILYSSNKLVCRMIIPNGRFPYQ